MNKSDGGGGEGECQKNADPEGEFEMECGS